MSHNLRIGLVSIFTSLFALCGLSAQAAIVFSNDFKADFRFTVVDGPLAG